MTAPARFHNTPNFSGEELKKRVASARSCAAAILDIYLTTRQAFTPYEIVGMLQRAGKKYGILSVRPRLTDLTRSGDLIMRMDLPQKNHGAEKEYQWSINPSKYPSALDGEQSKLFDTPSPNQ